MSISSMDSNLKSRLLSHLSNVDTRSPRESISHPNNGAAENFHLGTKEEMKPYVKFQLLNMKEQFNENDEPIVYPYFEETTTSLVACIKDPLDLTAKVNVYGVYKIKGISDILTQNPKKEIKWKTIEIPNELFYELSSIPRGVIGRRTQSSSSWWCAVS
jgi:hypothetical protein